MHRTATGNSVFYLYNVSMPESVSITTDSFEGPIDLLLRLIEKNKLQINAVSLAAVTQSFLDITREMTLTTKMLTEFITVLSTLIYLKSKSLLPLKNYNTESQEESGVLLQKRLQLLRYVRRTAQHPLFSGDGFGLIPRSVIQVRKQRVFHRDETLSPDVLCSLVSSLRTPVGMQLPEVSVGATVSLEEMTERILTTLNALRETSSDTAGVSLHTIPVVNKKDVIVLFLAVLELFKRNKVTVSQHSSFGILTVNRYGR